MSPDHHGAVRIATGGLGDHVDALTELLEDLGLDPSDGAWVVQVDATSKLVPTPGMWTPSAPSGRLLGTALRAG
jgi:hypothetical protein